VFDGAFSPWHLVILAFVVFLVAGPKKLADRLGGLGRSVEHLVSHDNAPDADASERAEFADSPVAPRRGLAYRLGRLPHRLFKGRRFAR
jgi:hypothetical protein